VKPLKGCDSNFEANIIQILKLLQMKHLPCIKQYVLEIINNNDQHSTDTQFSHKVQPYHLSL